MQQYGSNHSSKILKSRYRQYRRSASGNKRVQLSIYSNPNKIRVSNRHYKTQIRETHIKKLDINEVRHHIEAQQWTKIIPCVDELISRIDNGGISISFVSAILESSRQDHKMMEKNFFVYETSQAITALLKDVLACVVNGSMDNASMYAKRIREILVVAQEVSNAASMEGLVPLRHSQITQIDVVGGRPVYAIKQ